MVFGFQGVILTVTGMAPLIATLVGIALRRLGFEKGTIQNRREMKRLFKLGDENKREGRECLRKEEKRK